jgi:hypothetical protein
MLSAAIRARSAFARRRRPLGPSITSSRETPTPLEPSKWTPILLSLSKSNTSAARVRAKWPDQVRNGRRWSALRLHLKTLKPPTFLREYAKFARQCAADGQDHVQFLEHSLSEAQGA